jgi:hypothetical protein
MLQNRIVQHLGVARLATQPIYEAYREGNSSVTATAAYQIHAGPLTAYSILEREPVAHLQVSVHVGTHRQVAQLIQQQQQQQQQQDVGQMPATEQDNKLESEGEADGPEIWQDIGVQTSFLNREEEEEEEEHETVEENIKDILSDVDQRYRYTWLKFLDMLASCYFLC